MSVTFVLLLGLCLAYGKYIPNNENIQQQIEALLAQNYDAQKVINPHNMVTVPANCPVGQQLVNGVCRDIWRKFAVTQKSIVNPKNMISVPANCPSGQELVNGVCRDIWRNMAVTQRSNINPQNMITVPTNCPPGQQLINGVCRDIWRNMAVTQRSNINPHNVITVPTNCPEGQELVNGVCRDIWRNMAVTQRSINPKNMVTVPTNCPTGQELVNGVCRDIWRNADVRYEEYLENILKALVQREYSRAVRQANGEELNINPDDLLQMSVDRNIISVPNQCPDGYRPDSFGICREVLP